MPSHSQLIQLSEILLSHNFIADDFIIGNDKVTFTVGSVILGVSHEVIFKPDFDVDENYSNHNVSTYLMADNFVCEFRWFADGLIYFWPLQPTGTPDARIDITPDGDVISVYHFSREDKLLIIEITKFIRSCHEKFLRCK